MTEPQDKNGPRPPGGSRAEAWRVLQAWRDGRPYEPSEGTPPVANGASPEEVSGPPPPDMPPLKVSVALLTKNGEATLPGLLEALWQQKVAAPLEIVAVDSGSTDRTREILQERVKSVVAIDPGTFNHGLSRNLAIEQTTGDLVVLIVQDAVPTSERWLEHLTAPFFADETVAGTFARQVPRPEASAIARHYLAEWVGAADESWFSEIAGNAEWQAMTPQERFWRCIFDNVCSCIRRSVWTAHPFAETTIAEDVEWARDVLLDGHRIVYTPEAMVAHSHERSAGYEYRRTYLLHRRLWELFELQTIPTLPLAVRAAASTLALHLRYEQQRPAMWPHAAALAVAWPAGQYLGARAAVRGRPLPRWRPGTV